MRRPTPRSYLNKMNGHIKPEKIPLALELLSFIETHDTYLTQAVAFAYPLARPLPNIQSVNDEATNEINATLVSLGGLVIRLEDGTGKAEAISIKEWRGRDPEATDCHAWLFTAENGKSGIVNLDLRSFLAETRDDLLAQHPL
ncbi:MAG: hypothetical protein QG629_172 [Patescibacteria group bacterium]|nr:hypothetical protein [Candidatus Saccharibacteria bacterium]MDQ5963090.1 hypothetical protein [Patescibacteria group bacterium]